VRRVEHSVGAPLADRGRLRGGDRQQVERERQRLAVEVPGALDGAGLAEDDRVVDLAGELPIGDLAREPQRIPARPVHLRRAPQRVRVLHRVRGRAMRGDDL
jgi:hypothetical protein